MDTYNSIVHSKSIKSMKPYHYKIDTFGKSSTSTRCRLAIFTTYIDMAYNKGYSVNTSVDWTSSQLTNLCSQVTELLCYIKSFQLLGSHSLMGRHLNLAMFPHLY